ncbi:uncharacterized protein EI90DRAFT_2924682, partial [Cantharellus anzutake]|uniref:uncharacterized protein n=1 Tax=Cantharellus anzutake TaxID=1750568 RepID=UPI00190512D2
IPSPPVIPSESQSQGISDHPLLVPVTLCMLLSCLISYNTKTISTLGTITSIFSGFIGIWGVYVILFGKSSSTSKITGADKRTSRFIFGNKSAASSIKRQWKKDHM